MRIEQPLYEVVATAFGPVGIVWWEAENGPRVRQVVNGEAKFFKKELAERGLDRALQVKQFSQGDDTKIVQLRVGLNSRLGMLRPAALAADFSKPPMLIDEAGQRYAAIGELGAQLQRFLEGEAIVFDLGLVALEVCGDFQRRVLLAEYGVPRGWVSTYGRIALHLGLAGGARAVGQGLAGNPFPIVIPCHRAVRADGALGGYQGGPAMKRALLEMEGVRFTERGAVCMERVFY